MASIQGRRGGQHIRVPSRAIKEGDVPEIKKRIQSREFLNRIAADYDVNPGRISEIKTGKRYADIAAAV